MGLNLSNRQIAQELDLSVSDVQAMTEQLRIGLLPAHAVALDGEVEIDEVYVVAGHKGSRTRWPKRPLGAAAPAQGRTRPGHTRQREATDPGLDPARR